MEPVPYRPQPLITTAEQAVQMLRELGDHINFQDANTGFTALHQLACNENINTLVCARLMLMAGAKTNVLDYEWGYAPIHFSVQLFATDMLKVLLAGGADPDLKNEEGQTPLIMACSINGIETSLGTRRYAVRLVKLLLEHDANQELPDAEGQTPGTIAKKRNIPELIMLLCKDRIL